MSGLRRKALSVGWLFASVLWGWGVLGWASSSSPPSPSLPDPSTINIPSLAPTGKEIEDKNALYEVRGMGAALERVNPRPVFRQPAPYEGGGVRLELPYVSVSRKDILFSRMADPDCPNYDLPSFAKLLERPEFAAFRPWSDEASPEEKQKALEDRAKSLADGHCPDATWSLPYSSVIATREAAGALKRAWERFEDRYFWRVVTDINNPIYWLSFCGLGLGVESYSKGPRPPIDFIPQGSLPPELGAYLTKDIADLVSRFKADYFPLDPQKGVREATPNYHPESSGQFRKPLYLPFIPTVAPREFCDNLPIKLPILHIPAVRLSVCGVTVWTTPDYPDRPWLFDQGEADRRIQNAMAHAYARYYPDYLLEALLTLLPLSQLGNTATGILDTLSQAPLTPAGVADAISRVEGLMYFPVPWQAPILGGGAVITPVYDYLYPDALRIGADILTIYDMVGTLLKGDSLILLEKGALALYYLQPVLEYMDQPLLPGIVDLTLRQTPVGTAVEELYRIVRDVVAEGLDAFANGLSATAQAAFGPTAGLAFEAGVRIILAPLKEILAPGSDPKYFVRSTLKLLADIDRFLAAFQGTGFNFQNRINGVLVSPGLWRFEELKRVFPPSAPLTQRLFGYASFFGAWSEFRATIIPDPGAKWANPLEFSLAAISRLLGFWHVPIAIDVCIGGVAVYPEIPRYMPLAPYFLPFAGEQINWGWFSVPEGYPLPLVKGIPGGPLPALGADHPYSGKYTGAPGLADFYEKVLLGLRR